LKVKFHFIQDIVRSHKEVLAITHRQNYVNIEYNSQEK